MLGVARIAAIQAAKRTGELIPLCHPLALTRVAVEFEVDQRCYRAIECRATVETFGRTGVEMEALTAVTVGLLTIYDMCKAVDRGMHFEGVRLLEKKGGRSGDWACTGAITVRGERRKRTAALRSGVSCRPAARPLEPRAESCFVSLACAILWACALILVGSVPLACMAETRRSHGAAACARRLQRQLPGLSSDTRAIPPRSVSPTSDRR